MLLFPYFNLLQNVTECLIQRQVALKHILSVINSWIPQTGSYFPSFQRQRPISFKCHNAPTLPCGKKSNISEIFYSVTIQNSKLISTPSFLHCEHRQCNFNTPISVSQCYDGRPGLFWTPSAQIQYVSPVDNMISF